MRPFSFSSRRETETLTRWRWSPFVMSEGVSAFVCWLRYARTFFLRFPLRSHASSRKLADRFMGWSWVRWDLRRVYRFLSPLKNRKSGQAGKICLMSRWLAAPAWSLLAVVSGGLLSVRDFFDWVGFCRACWLTVPVGLGPVCTGSGFCRNRWSRMVSWG